ncbi:MAG: PD-(D/E)XK nuclease family protein, partial [Solirubrobacteraceae bacterium]
GVLLHALLERLDFRRPATPNHDAVGAAAARAGLMPPPGPGEADELAAVIRRFAGSELCSRLARAIDAAREQRFAFPGPGGLLVVGAIDLLAREPDGRSLVVDFKSDRLAGASPSAVVASEYAIQRLIYALAAMLAGATEVEVAYCFLERPENPVIRPYERRELNDLEAELERLTEPLLASRFEVSPAPHRGVCAGCPAEGGLCSWPVEMTGRESPDRLF